MGEQRRAFVIMPFDPEFAAIYEELILPALEKAAYSVKRADSLFDQQNILKDIVRGLAAADLVVADLTALNPNVLYELGIAHALHRPTVVLTQSVEELPFDLRSYRVIPYETAFNRIGQLGELLYQVAQRARAGEVSFSNPVSDFLPHASSDSLAAEPLAVQHSDSVDGDVTTTSATEEDEEAGLWDYIASAESSQVGIIESLQAILSDTADIGERMKRRTAEVHAIQSSSGPGIAARMQKQLSLAAAEIKSYAARIEDHATAYHDAWEVFADGSTGMLSGVQLSDPSNLEAVRSYRATIAKLEPALTTSLDSIREFRESQSELRGGSRDMNSAAKRSTSALDRLVGELEQSEAYVAKILDICNERLADFDDDGTDT